MEGKVVVITGASSGIGKATALEIAKRGGRIVLSSRRPQALDSIVQSIKLQGGEAAYFAADVSSQEEVQQLADYAIKQYGKIDVWINNAGIMPLSFLNKRRVHEWEKMIDINIKGVLYGIAAVLPFMEKQNSGHIINIGSVGGRNVGLAGSIYSGTKFAVRAITEGLRKELSHESLNIKTTLISPGMVETNLTETVTDQEALTSLLERAGKNPLDSADVAQAICYAIEQPSGVGVNEIIMRSLGQMY